jgi:hypothetical protein
MTAFDPAITSSTNAIVTRGEPFLYEITAIDDPTGFSVTNLPTGLSLDSSSGIISGTPMVSGVFPITVTATNDVGSGTATLTLTVLNPFSIQNVSFDPVSGNLTMAYGSLLGQSYGIQATTNLLAGWTTITNLTATGTATTNTLTGQLFNSIFGTTSYPQVFLRVSAP